MNADVKALWVAALRSGEYHQGIGQLRRVESPAYDTFCCLGVLCDLAVEAEVPVETRIKDYGDWAYDGKWDTPPDAVSKWAGLPASNPQLLVGAARVPLSELNDDEGLSFAELADLIEAQL